jgi:rhodanese-related sulfurtransferase
MIVSAAHDACRAIPNPKLLFRQGGLQFGRWNARKVAGLLWILFGCCIPAFVGTGCAQRTTDKDIKSLNVAQVRRLVLERDKGNAKAILLIDPRAKRDFEEGHIPTARNLLLSDVPIGSEIDEQIASHENIVVYGTDPGSAPARGMVKRLIGLGYEHVRFLEGGLKGWKEQGGEVATGK